MYFRVRLNKLKTMTSRDFVFWLQGFYELTDPTTLNAQQTDLIKRHLALVFVHDIDPTMGNAEQQEKLNSIHNDNKSEVKYRC